MGKLKIGWSEISITPDKKVALAGQFAERISEYVEKPITATAMAVTDGEEQMTLVSCDLVSIGWNLVTAVRKNLEGNTLGIDPMKIVLNAIHTHTGPVYKNIRRSASAVGLSSNNRTLLEALLPEGSKYVESAPVSNNPDIASKVIFSLQLGRTSAADYILPAFVQVSVIIQGDEPELRIEPEGHGPLQLCPEIVFRNGAAETGHERL